MKLEDIILKYSAEEKPSFDALLAEIRSSDEWTDHEAEIRSLKEENDSLVKSAAETKKELDETKKLNFTLGRQVSRQPGMSADQIINEMFDRR